MLSRVVQQFRERHFNRCNGCRKFKPFVRRRSFFSRQMNTTLTSKELMCRSCISLIKRI